MKRLQFVVTISSEHLQCISVDVFRGLGRQLGIKGYMRDLFSCYPSSTNFEHIKQSRKLCFISMEGAMKPREKYLLSSAVCPPALSANYRPNIFVFSFQKSDLATRKRSRLDKLQKDPLRSSSSLAIARLLLLLLASIIRILHLSRILHIV